MYRFILQLHFLTNVLLFDSGFHQLMPASLSMSSRYLLPHWCVYIAYTLCFVLSGFSVIVTILYGHAFGKDLALKWLLAFFISFIDSVFILEPLKVGSPCLSLLQTRVDIGERLYLILGSITIDVNSPLLLPGSD